MNHVEKEDSIRSDRRPGGALLFGSLFTRLFGAAPPASLYNQAATRPLERLEQELEDMSEETEVRLHVWEESGRGTPSGSSGRTADPQDLLKRQREEARQALETHIGGLHQQLRTGIDASLRDRLMRLLIAHAPLPAERPRPSIGERIERSVLGELFSRAGEAAWLRLADLMAKSGLVWPAQEGLPETLSPEELDRLREKHRGDIQRAFLAATPAQQADLIRGEVETWTYGYPAKGSYLWLQTALRGVAAALCAQYFAAALELWIWRSPEIDGDLVASLDKKLEPARKALRGGLRSLAEALDLSARIDDVCERAIPSMVWKRILPRLDWVGSGQVAPPVSVLAMGLSRLDPVCGMFLTSGRVAERVERAGETLYFCSRGCRERFEANPS